MPKKPAVKSTQVNNSARYAEAERVLARYEDLLHNAGSIRSNFLRELMDPRRNVDAECGYPKNISLTMLQEMHKRNPYARRLNEVMAKEAFQANMLVYETDDQETTTPFETSVDELGKKIRGGKSWRKDDSQVTVSSILQRAITAASTYHYGIILIGLNDGLPLSQPVAGVEEVYSMPGRYEGQEPPKGWTDPYTGNARTRVIAANSANPPEGVYSLKTNAVLQQSILTINAVTDDDGQQLTDEEGKPKFDTKRVKGEREVTYLRVYPETQAAVTRWEMNRMSPRFGKPVSYLVSLVDWNNPNTSELATGMPGGTVDVHWTRVVHIPGPDLNPDEVTGTPECEPVFNELMNLDKIRGASGEGYWKGAFTPLSVESLPNLGPNPKINRDAVRGAIENFENSLTRVLSVMGVTVKPISVSVADPTPHVAINVEAICIRKGMPKRKFMGSERGELSSSEDEGDWNDKLKAFTSSYVIPYAAGPLFDHLILIGALKEPGEDGYTIEFESISAQSDQEVAQVALAKTQAIAAAIQGNVFTVIPEKRFLTTFTNFMDEDEAEAALEEAEEAQEELALENEQLAAEEGMIPQPPEGFEWDEPEEEEEDSPFANADA